MINIFIGLSNNQISSFEAIIKKENLLGKNILIANQTLNFNKELWDEIVYGETTFNNRSKGITASFYNLYGKIKEYKKIIKQLAKYKNQEDINLYFTYIEDVLTNYLFLSFNKRLKGIVVEDGTLNYYSHTIKDVSLKKRWLKWLISNLMGVRFKFYKGHSSGIEYQHALKQYLRVPELSVFPKKAVRLPYDNRRANLTNTLLIIGQEPYINLYGLKRYDEAMNSLIEIIKKSPEYASLTKIYYKPHRHGERIDYDKMTKAFQNKPLEIILDADAPLEDLYFEKLGSKYIFTFDSSALINIYLEASKDLKDTINFNVLLRYKYMLKHIFKKFDFNIYT